MLGQHSKVQLMVHLHFHQLDFAFTITSQVLGACNTLHKSTSMRALNVTKEPPVDSYLYRLIVEAYILKRVNILVAWRRLHLRNTAIS